VFGFLLEIANKHDRAKRIGVDASEAALRRLVRRDTGEDYQEMLRRLARESGIETPSALIRFDRSRKGKSNADWASPPAVRIARMKDGTSRISRSTPSTPA
jgi:transposase